MTRTEMNEARRRPSLVGGRQEEGRVVMRSVVRCLEGNMHGCEGVRELCLVVGPGVLRCSGDVGKVQSNKGGIEKVFEGYLNERTCDHLAKRRVCNDVQVVHKSELLIERDH